VQRVDARGWTVSWIQFPLIAEAWDGLSMRAVAAVFFARRLQLIARQPRDQRVTLYNTIFNNATEYVIQYQCRRTVCCTVHVHLV
jgi:hypothetical protein